MTSSSRPRTAVLALVLFGALASGAWAQARQGTAAAPPDLEDFFRATDLDEEVAAAALARLDAAWDDRYANLFVDLLDMMRRTGMVNPLEWFRLARIAAFLERKTGQTFGVDVAQWRQWVWSLPYDPHPKYPDLKARLYGVLDIAFVDFFRTPLRTAIRLDEVQWGGVAVNGIPPLDHPAHIDAADAAYLDDGNVVFGIAIEGVSRAYPKRILAWHELARDRVGTRELTVVYCTLCGTVIPWESRAGGQVRTFGTSGLLYRSNKLMFDEETLSLWSSLEGTPVVGPLVGSGLRLSPLPVVTTTWGEWRRLHPDTTVLSPDTGFVRDYSEGAAYRTYFATDRLMFDVSQKDLRMANKAEVLALRLAGPGGAPAPPLAISADFLLAHPVYHVEGADPPLLVVTTPGGANRVYQSGERRFERLDGMGRVLDTEGRAWQVEEDRLRATFDGTLSLPRVPAHRAFWFGWYAQHPETRLIR